jgi:hypothetical protein
VIWSEKCKSGPAATNSSRCLATQACAAASA